MDQMIIIHNNKQQDNMSCQTEKLHIQDTLKSEEAQRMSYDNH